MLTRIVRGDVPSKLHSALRDAQGQLRYEHCLTRDGFDGPFTVSYHQFRPQAFELSPSDVVWPRPVTATGSEGDRLRRRHLEPPAGFPTGDAIVARLPLLCNDDVTVSVCAPSEGAPRYFLNGDADELVFVREGGGKLMSPFGELGFSAGSYLYVPKGVPHRFEPVGSQHWLSLELRDRLCIPRAYKNEVGQLTLNAPYSHRDFSLPDFVGPVDEGIRDVLVKRDETLFQARYSHSPLDMVGFDGAIYPFAFPILAFQPRTGSVHLPPTVHGTFETSSVLVCSFVPRPLDFAKEAIPCPYPHSSSDIDELLYYVAGSFTSRTGVRPGSITWHPRGLPHGPHPGRYENSQANRHTDEVAVMLDCKHPLSPTRHASRLDDPEYERSFLG